MVKKYAPSTGSWTTAAYTANEGKLSLKALRLNLSGQTNTKFMVLIAPNAADLTMVTDDYDNSSTLGLKVNLNGKTEYTLFTKASTVSAGDVSATANTVLTSEDDEGSGHVCNPAGQALALCPQPPPGFYRLVGMPRRVFMGEAAVPPSRLAHLRRSEIWMH